MVEESRLAFQTSTAVWDFLLLEGEPHSGGWARTDAISCRRNPAHTRTPSSRAIFGLERAIPRITKQNLCVLCALT